MVHCCRRDVSMLTVLILISVFLDRFETNYCFTLFLPHPWHCVILFSLLPLSCLSILPTTLPSSQLSLIFISLVFILLNIFWRFCWNQKKKMLQFSSLSPEECISWTLLLCPFKFQNIFRDATLRYCIIIFLHYMKFILTLCIPLTHINIALFFFLLDFKRIGSKPHSICYYSWGYFCLTPSD